MRLCGAELFPTTGILDRRAVSSTGPEYGEIRDLRLFADDREAHRFLTEIRRAVAACPEQDVGGTIWRHRLRASGVSGQETLTAVQTFETDGVVPPGANWWEVARVGNAVLLTGTGGEWPPGRPLDRAIREHARGVSPVVRSMCVFAADGCASGIPDDFPLAAGYPDDDEAEPGPGYGRHGPSRTLAPTSVHGVRKTSSARRPRRPAARPLDQRRGLPRPAADHLPRRRAWPPPASPPSPTSTAGAPSRTRATTTSSSRTYAAPPTATSRGPSYAAWSCGGAPGVGLTVLHIVRVGRAVLVDTASNEGGAGPDPEGDIRRQIGEQARASTARRRRHVRLHRSRLPALSRACGG